MHTPVITQKFRERTDAARVLMLLGVVLIHCNILSFIPGGGNRAVTCAVGFFSEGLPSMCVPWFFLVSAYLSAIRRSDADYGGFVRRRVRSILVPYLVWNSLAVAVRMAVQLTPLGQYTSGGHQFTSLWQTLVDVYVEPALWPLWFLRNLFVFTLMLPVLRRMIDRNIAVTLAVLLIADTFTPLVGIFYYGAGVAAARLLSPAGAERMLGRCGWLFPLYCAVTFVSVWCGFDLFSVPVLRNVMSIVGMAGLWGLALRGGWSGLGFLGRPDATFFVYAFHGLVSPYIVKGLVRCVPWEGYGWLCCYAVAFSGVAGVSYAVYYAVSLSCGRVLPWLTGGRSAGV